MYIDKKFSEGTRSQEAIRRVAQALDHLPPDDSKISDFFANERELYGSGWKWDESTGKSPLVEACRSLAEILVDIEQFFAAAELRALERTASVLNKVLDSRTAE